MTTGDERPAGLPRTYSAEEVAPLLGLTPGALKQGCKVGRYIGRKIGREWRFTTEDVAAIIAAAKQRVNTERAHKIDASRRTRTRRAPAAGSGTVTPFTAKPGPKRTRRAV